MTTRYVGIGGSDANDGLSWANRKLTLNGAEDTPVVAGDTVYVGPGVYRHTLTVDVSGSDGSPITYIGDVTGEHTDGVGGIVRITGSDNDTTNTRSRCITGSSKNYRTFRGFAGDMCTEHVINCSSSTNWIVEDCDLHSRDANGCNAILFDGTQSSHTVRRCRLSGAGGGNGIHFSHTSVVDDTGHLVENCLIEQGFYGITMTRVGGGTIKNCTIINSMSVGIRVATALTVGQIWNVNNCIIAYNPTGLRSTTSTEITEDYNALFGNATARNTTGTGANSNTYPPLFNTKILVDGFRYPHYYAELGKWSQLARIAGTGEASEDFFGIARPATSSKKSWGAIQYTGAVRETTTTQGSSAASIKLPDAGEQFLMRVPVTNVSTTISIYCYREADYAGTNPIMIIKQPGQSDRTTTDAGSASTWNQLTDTFTPASLPPYVDVFVKSSNTATSGNYDAFFDTLAVS